MGAELSSDCTPEKDKYFSEFSVENLFNDLFMASVSDSLPVYASTNEDYRDSSNMNFKHNRRARSGADPKNKQTSPFAEATSFTDYQRDTFSKLRGICVSPSPVKISTERGNDAAGKPQSTVGEFSLLSAEAESTYSSTATAGERYLRNSITKSIDLLAADTSDEIFALRRKRFLMRVHVAYKRLSDSIRAAAGRTEQQEYFQPEPGVEEVANTREVASDMLLNMAVNMCMRLSGAKCGASKGTINAPMFEVVVNSVMDALRQPSLDIVQLDSSKIWQSNMEKLAAIAKDILGATNADKSTDTQVHALALLFAIAVSTGSVNSLLDVTDYLEKASQSAEPLILPASAAPFLQFLEQKATSEARFSLDTVRKETSAASFKCQVALLESKIKERNRDLLYALKVDAGLTDGPADPGIGNRTRGRLVAECISSSRFFDSSTVATDGSALYYFEDSSAAIRKVGNGFYGTVAGYEIAKNVNLKKQVAELFARRITETSKEASLVCKDVSTGNSVKPVDMAIVDVGAKINKEDTEQLYYPTFIDKSGDVDEAGEGEDGDEEEEEEEEDSDEDIDDEDANSNAPPRSQQKSHKKLLKTRACRLFISNMEVGFYGPVSDSSEPTNGVGGDSDDDRNSEQGDGSSHGSRASILANNIPGAGRSEMRGPARSSPRGVLAASPEVLSGCSSDEGSNLSGNEYGDGSSGDDDGDDDQESEHSDSYQTTSTELASDCDKSLAAALDKELNSNGRKSVSLMASIGQPINLSVDFIVPLTENASDRAQIVNKKVTNFFEVSIKQGPDCRVFLGFSSAFGQIEYCTDGEITVYPSASAIEKEPDFAVKRTFKLHACKMIGDLSTSREGIYGWGVDPVRKKVIFVHGGRQFETDSNGNQLPSSIFDVSQTESDLNPFVRVELPPKLNESRSYVNIKLNTGSRPFESFLVADDESSASKDSLFDACRAIISRENIVERVDGGVTCADADAITTAGSSALARRRSYRSTEAKIENSQKQIDLRLKEFSRTHLHASLAYDAGTNCLLLSSHSLVGPDHLAVLDPVTLSVLSIVDLTPRQVLSAGEIDVVEAFPALKNSRAESLPSPYLVSAGESVLLIRSRLVAKNHFRAINVDATGKVVERAGDVDSSDSETDEAAVEDPTDLPVGGVQGCPLTLADIEVISLVFQSGNEEDDCVDMDADTYVKARVQDPSLADGALDADFPLGLNRFQEGFKKSRQVKVTFMIPYINLSSGEYCRSLNRVKWNSQTYSVTFTSGFAAGKDTDSFYPFGKHLLDAAWREVMCAKTILEVQKVTIGADKVMQKIGECRLEQKASMFSMSSRTADYDAAVALSAGNATILSRPRLKHVINAYSNGVQLVLCSALEYHLQQSKSNIQDLAGSCAYKSQIQTFSVGTGKSVSPAIAANDDRVLSSEAGICYDLQSNFIWAWDSYAGTMYQFRNNGLWPKLYKDPNGTCKHLDNGSPVSFSLNPLRRLAWMKSLSDVQESLVSKLYCLAETLAEPYINPTEPLNPALPPGGAETETNGGTCAAITLVSRPSARGSNTDDDDGESMIVVRGQVLYNSKNSAGKDPRTKYTSKLHERGFHVAILSSRSPHLPLGAVRHFPAYDPASKTSDKDSKHRHEQESDSESYDSDENEEEDDDDDDDDDDADDDDDDEDDEDDEDDGDDDDDEDDDGDDAGDDDESNNSDNSGNEHEEDGRENPAIRAPAAAQLYPKVTIKGDGNAVRLSGESMADYISSCPHGAIVLVTSHFNACSRHYSERMAYALESIGVLPVHAETVLRPMSGVRAKEHDALCARSVVIIGCKGARAGAAKYVIVTHGGHTIQNGSHSAPTGSARINLRIKLPYASVAMCLDPGLKHLFKRLINTCISRHAHLSSISASLRNNSGVLDFTRTDFSHAISIFISNLKLLMANLNALVNGASIEDRLNIIPKRYSNKLKDFAYEMVDKPLFKPSARSEAGGFQSAVYHSLSQCGLQLFTICSPLHYPTPESMVGLLLNLLELYAQGDITPVKTQILRGVLTQMRSAHFILRLSLGESEFSLTKVTKSLMDVIVTEISKQLKIAVRADATAESLVETAVVTEGVVDVVSPLMTAILSSACNSTVSGKDAAEKQTGLIEIMDFVNLWAEECAIIAKAGAAALEEASNKTLVETVLEKSPLVRILPGILFSVVNIIDALEAFDSSDVRDKAYKVGDKVDVLTGPQGSGEEEWLLAVIETVDAEANTYTIKYESREPEILTFEESKIRIRSFAESPNLDSGKPSTRNFKEGDILLANLDHLEKTIKTLEECRKAVQQIKTLFPEERLVKKAPIIPKDDFICTTYTSKVVESKHPYASNMNTCEIFSFPNASLITISFDSRCHTEQSADYLQIMSVKDGIVGSEILRCTGRASSSGNREGWPGTNDFPAFELPRGQTSFALKFFSDYSCEEWGYKMTINFTMQFARIMPSVEYHWVQLIDNRIKQTLTLLFSRLLRTEKAEETLERKMYPILMSPLVQEKLSTLLSGALETTEANAVIMDLINGQQKPEMAKLLSHMQRFVSEANQMSHILPINRAVYACVSALIRGDGLEDELVSLYMSCKANQDGGDNCATPSKRLIEVWKKGQNIRKEFIHLIKTIDSSGNEEGKLTEDSKSDKSSKDMVVLSNAIVDNALFLLLSTSPESPSYNNRGSDAYVYKYDSLKYDAISKVVKNSATGAAVSLLRSLSPSQERILADDEDDEPEDMADFVAHPPTLNHSTSVFTSELHSASLPRPPVNPSELRQSSEMNFGGSPALSRAMSSSAAASGNSLSSLEMPLKPSLLRSSSIGQRIPNEMNASSPSPWSPPRSVGRFPGTLYSATSEVSAALRLRNMIAYRRRQRQQKQQLADEVGNSKVKRSDAIMQFVLSCTESADEKGSANAATAVTTTVTSLRALHILQNKRAKCRMMAMDIAVNILSSVNDGEGIRSCAALRASNRGPIMEVIKSLADVLRENYREAAESVQSESVSTINKDVAAEQHICANVRGCEPKKSLQLRNMFGLLMKYIVKFSCLLYEQFEEDEVASCDPAMIVAYKTDIMTCIRAISYDYKVEDSFHLENSGLVDTLLSRLMRCMHDKDLRIAGEQLLNLLVQRCIVVKNGSLERLLGSPANKSGPSFRSGLTNKLLRLMGKSLEWLNEKSQGLANPFYKGEFSSQNGSIVLLKGPTLFRGDLVGSAGCSHSHVASGFNHSFSLWIKRPTSTDRLIEAVSGNNEAGVPTIGGIIIVGSTVMRSHDEAWAEKLKNTDGGVGNIGLVVSIETVKIKEKKKKKKKNEKSASKYGSLEDFVVVKWNQTTEARDCVGFIAAPVKYRRKHLSLACSTVGGHIYSKGSSSLQPKSLDLENRNISPWSVYGLSLLPDATLNVFVANQMPAKISPKRVHTGSEESNQSATNNEEEQEGFDSGAAFVSMRSKISIPANRWTHVVISQEREKTTIYINSDTEAQSKECQKALTTISPSFSQNKLNSATTESFSSKVNANNKDSSASVVPAKAMYYEETFSLVSEIMPMSTSNSSRNSRIIESPHPYLDSQDTYEEITFDDDVEEIEITFDSQSCTESGCDFVKFYVDSSHNEQYGENMYHGGNNSNRRQFPGVIEEPVSNPENVGQNENIVNPMNYTAKPPLIIPSNKFILHFHSDSSGNYWGYKVYIRATKLKSQQNVTDTEKKKRVKTIDSIATINELPFYFGQRQPSVGCPSINMASSVNAVIGDLRLIPLALDTMCRVDLTARSLREINPAVHAVPFVDLHHAIHVMHALKVAVKSLVEDNVPNASGRLGQLPFDAGAMISVLFRLIRTNAQWDYSATIQLVCVEILTLLLPYAGIDIMQTVDGKQIGLYLMNLLKEIGKLTKMPTVEQSSNQAGKCRASESDAIVSNNLKLARAIATAGKVSSVLALAEVVKQTIVMVEPLLAEISTETVGESGSLDLVYGILSFFGGSFAGMGCGESAMYTPVGGISEKVIVLGNTGPPTNQLRNWTAYFGRNKSDLKQHSQMQEYVERWAGATHYGDAVVVMLPAEGSVLVVPAKDLQYIDSTSAALDCSMNADLVEAIGSDRLLDFYMSLVKFTPTNMLGYHINMIATKSLHALISQNSVLTQWLATAKDSLCAALVGSSFAPFSDSKDDQRIAGKMVSSKSGNIQNDPDSDWDTDEETNSMSESAELKAGKTNKSKIAKEIRKNLLLPVIFESQHPYADSLDLLGSVSIPGATSLVLVFDKECATEQGADFLKIYYDKEKARQAHNDSFTGGYQGRAGGSFPGTNGIPPLVIEADTFWHFFHSDSSVHDWGYRATVYPAHEKGGKDVLEKMEGDEKSITKLKRTLSFLKKDTAVGVGLLHLDGCINERFADVQLAALCYKHVQAHLVDGPRLTNLSPKLPLASKEGTVRLLNELYVPLDKMEVQPSAAPLRSKMNMLLDASRRALTPAAWHDEHALRCHSAMKAAKRSATSRCVIAGASSVEHSAFQCTENESENENENVSKNGKLLSSPVKLVNMLRTDSRYVASADILRSWKTPVKGESLSSHLEGRMTSLCKMLARLYALQCLHTVVSTCGKTAESSLVLALASSSIDAHLDSKKLDLCRKQLLDLLKEEEAVSTDKTLNALVCHASCVLADAKQLSATPESAVAEAVVVESAHPPAAQHKQDWKITVPGASWLCVAFDSRSHTHMQMQSPLPEALDELTVLKEDALKDWEATVAALEVPKPLAAAAEPVDLVVTTSAASDSTNAKIFESKMALLTNDENNQGAYVTVTPGTYIDESAIRFCGHHWPLSPETPPPREWSSGSEREKTRQRVLHGSFLRIDGDTLTVRYVSNDTRAPRWGFRCIVYGMAGPAEKALSVPPTLPKRSRQVVLQNPAQRLLVYWIMDTLLAYSAAGGVRPRFTRAIYTAAIFNGLCSVLLPGAVNSSANPDMLQEDLFVSHTHGIEANAEANIQNACLKTLSNMLQILPAVVRAGGISNEAELRSTLNSMKAQLVRVVARLREKEHEEIFPGSQEIKEIKEKREKEAADLIGRMVLVTSKCSGNEQKRTAIGNIVRVESGGELFVVDFEGTRDTKSLPSTSVEVSADPNRMSAEPSSASGGSAYLCEGDMVSCYFRGRARLCDGTITRVHGSGTYDIRYADGGAESEVNPELVTLRQRGPNSQSRSSTEPAAASAVSSVLDVAPNFDARYGVKRYSIRRFAEYKETGLQFEQVLHDDLVLWPSMQPLPKFDETFIPYSLMSPAGSGGVALQNFQCGDIAGTTTSTHRLNIILAGNLAPFCYSAKLQQLLEVLAQLETSLIAMTTVSSARMENSASASLANQLSSGKDISPWLQRISGVTALMKIMRSHVVPDILLRTLYLPLASAVTRQYLRLPPSGEPDTEVRYNHNIKVPTASALLLLFNQTCLNLKWDSETGILLLNVETLQGSGKAPGDSAGQLQSRNEVIRKFMANCIPGLVDDKSQGKENGFRIHEAVGFSACEIERGSCVLSVPVALGLHCVVVPAYVLSAATALSHSPSSESGTFQSLLHAKILHRHLKNLDALFGSNGCINGKHQIRESDIALTAHVNSYWNKISDFDPKRAEGPQWADVKPTEEILRRSAPLQLLHAPPACVDSSGVGGGYKSWNVYHPVLALQELVHQTSFDAAKSAFDDADKPIELIVVADEEESVEQKQDDEVNKDSCAKKVMSEAASADNAAKEGEEGLTGSSYIDADVNSDADVAEGQAEPAAESNDVANAFNPHGRMPFVDYRYCMCPQRHIMSVCMSMPSTYSLQSTVICDACSYQWRRITPEYIVWHCGPCRSDYCGSCATKIFQKMQEDDPNAPKYVAPKKSEALTENTAIQYNNVILDALFYAPMVDASAWSPTACSVRFDFLCSLNKHLADCLVCIDLSRVAESSTVTSLANMLGHCRGLLFAGLSQDLWKCVLMRTGISSQKGFELRVSRSLAKNHEHTPDIDGRFSVFSQAFRRMHGMSPTKLRRSSKLYNLVLMGERSQDAGGPYRESFDIYMSEIQSKALSLLLPTPNGTHKVGFNRDRWVFNPGATSRIELEMLAFFGKLLGIAIRSESYLNLNLSQFMWKLICSETPTLADLEGIDCGVVQNVLESFRNIDQGANAMDAEQFSMTFFETFTVDSTDNRTVELCPGGAAMDVTFENRKEYCDLVERYRLHEFDLQAAAVRRGLATIVPIHMLNILTWEALERSVCGRANVDVDLLESCTTYEGCSRSDKHIENFWQIVRAFDTQERQALLKFTWGRSRLPLTREAFKERFTISAFHHEPVDQYYPVSHTCFFNLELPRYSTKKIMKEKLLYAIFNCLAIDGDETDQAIQAAWMGWDEEEQ